MIDPKLINLLRCPSDGSRLHLADPLLVARINGQIQQGVARDRQDQRVIEPIDGGLVNEKGDRVYPIRGGIPTLVADEAIRLYS
jgi:uncharacterized protein YbaR (Trm112 family)